MASGSYCVANPDIEVMAQLRPKFPLLERLGLSRYQILRRDDFDAFRTLFTTATSLKSLRVSSMHAVELASVPFHLLEFLAESVAGLLPDDISHSTFGEKDRAQIFSRGTHLRTLSLTGGSVILRNPTVMPHLRVLRIRDAAELQVVDALNLPSLQELEIIPDTTLPTTSVRLGGWVELTKRSECSLQRVMLTYTVDATREIIALLQCSNTLEEFDVGVVEEPDVLLQHLTLGSSPNSSNADPAQIEILPPKLCHFAFSFKDKLDTLPSPGRLLAMMNSRCRTAQSFQDEVKKREFSSCYHARLCPYANSGGLTMRLEKGYDLESRTSRLNGDENPFTSANITIKAFTRITLLVIWDNLQQLYDGEITRHFSVVIE